MTTITTQYDSSKRKSTIDFIVDEIMKAELPISREAARDLLTMSTPSEIKNMSIPQAITVDKMLPFVLAFSEIGTRDDILNMADKTIFINGTQMPVWQAVNNKVPIDFIIASLKIHPQVCRWYALEWISDTGAETLEKFTAWPDSSDELVSIINTKFDLKYLHEQVKVYLDTTYDESWLDLLGIPVKLVGVRQGLTTRELIHDIFVFLANGKSELISSDNQKDYQSSIDIIRKIVPVLVIRHYNEVSYIMSNIQTISNFKLAYGISKV